METTDDLLDLGLAIILLRSILRWSQAELARQSGVDKGLLSDYEAGYRRPTRRTLRRLAASVGVDVTFIDELVPLCRGLRLAFENARQGKPAGILAEIRSSPGMVAEVTGAVQEALEPFLLRWKRRGPSSLRPRRSA